MRRAKPRETTPSKPAITPLPWDEWDFRERSFAADAPLEDKPLNACLSYEIHRFLYHDPTFECCRREVDKWRTSERTCKEDFSDIGSTDNFTLIPWLNWPEWPETPFLALSEERQQAAALANRNHSEENSRRHAEHSAERMGTTDPESVELWLRSGVIGSGAPMQTPIKQCDPAFYGNVKWVGEQKEIDGPHFTIAAFHFDWSRTNQNILNELEEWLVVARKRFCDSMDPTDHLKGDFERGLETRGTKPVDSTYADINALGAYRLSRHYKGDSAALKWLNAQRPNSPLIDAADWSRRMSRARYFLYQDSLNWISSQDDHVWCDGKPHRFEDFSRYLWPSDIKAMIATAEENIAAGVSNDPDDFDQAD